MVIFFIKKIWKKEIDSSAHKQFVKFSKGVFENKAVMNVRRNGKIKISATYELANDLILLASSLVPKINISGIILTKNAIPGLEGKEKSGLFNYNINQEMDSKKLYEIVENSHYALLDCSGEGIDLKMKKKLPRPSSKSIEKVKDKFCLMQLDIKFWPKVKDEFLFDLPEGKKYRMIHKYEIKEIIMPKGEKDFAKIRLMAKRKGILTRSVEIDEKTSSQQTDFEA